MKKFTLIAVLLLLACVGIHAQGLTLSLDITAGGLKAAMTSEQKKAVTNLTLTGSMNDSDFYLIRDSLYRLKYLDLKYVEADTIPAKAFYRNDIIQRVILPLHVKYIGDETFCESSVEPFITDTFPRLGDKVFRTDSGLHPSITEDNTSCVLINNSIYSSDGKVLYFYYGADNIGNLDTIPEGTEVIAERAFDCSWLKSNVIFPSTLKRIDNYAFKNTEVLVCAGSYHDFIPDWFFFKSENPPALAEKAFEFESIFLKSFFYIIVPKGTKEFYKNSDPQWFNFKYILEEGETPPSDISSIALRPTTIVKGGMFWKITGESQINKIEVFSLSGILIDSILCDDIEVFFPVTRYHSMRILKVYFADGQTDVLKLTN